MKALLSVSLATFVFLSVAYGASLGEWTNLRGGSSMDSYSGGIQLHPPFEIDWKEANKSCKGFLCVKDRLVVLSTDEITIYAISTRDLIKRIHAEPVCNPCIIDNLLVVATEGKLTTYNLDQGKTVIELSPFSGIRHILDTHFGVMVFTKTQVHCIDEKGVTKNTILLDSEISGNPVITGKFIVCPLSNGSIKSYSIQTFELLNELQNVGPFTSCTGISEDIVLVSLSKGGCSLVNLNDQKILWSDREPRGGNVKTIFDGLHPIVYGHESGITCKRLDGSTLWKNNLYEPLSMFATPRILFITTSDGQLRTFQTATGDELNPFQLNNKATNGFMAFKDDRLYIPMSTEFVRIVTSPYKAVLGFAGATDFGRFYPNSRNVREFTIINLSLQKQSLLLHSMTPGLYIKQRFFDIPSKESITVQCIYTTIDVLNLDLKGVIKVDTSLYRYNLGVSLKVEQLIGDCNLDCKVDMTDLALIGKLFGVRVPSQYYRMEVDQDRNGVIDLVDAGIVLSNMGVVSAR